MEPLPDSRLLLEFSLAAQIFGNYLFSRETTVQYVWTGRTSAVWRLLSARLLAFCVLGLVLTPLGYAFGHDLLGFVLYAALIMTTAVGQTIRQLEAGRRRAFGWPLVVTLATCVTFGLCARSHVGGDAVLAVLLAGSVLAVRAECAPGAGDRVGPKDHVTLGAKRVGLWAAGVGTAEYDRFLVGQRGSAVEGAQLGLLSSFVMVPLAIVSSIGPRLVRMPISRARDLTVAAVGAIYLVGTVAIGWFLLSFPVLVLLAGSATKVFIHLIYARPYYRIMAHNSWGLRHCGHCVYNGRSLGNISLGWQPLLSCRDHESLAGIVLAALLLAADSLPWPGSSDDKVHTPPANLSSVPISRVLRWPSGAAFLGGGLRRQKNNETKLCALLIEDPVFRVPEFRGEFSIVKESDLLIRLLGDGEYEPILVKRLQEHVNVKRDAIDVGANVGFYSVLLARMLIWAAYSQSNPIPPPWRA